MSTAALTRDTDADWRRLGEDQPYWGVLSAPEYRSDALTDAGVEQFYATGRAQVAALRALVRQAAAGAPDPSLGRVLDFGCGVGRLTEAMADHAAAVTGVDVAPGMLERARRRGAASGDRVRYLDALPDEPFDWVNSYIVLQHIPPARGLPLIAELLARVAPGGAATLHVIAGGPMRAAERAEPGWRLHLRELAAPVLRRLGRAAPEWALGRIGMYDYDLGAVVELFRRAGLPDVSLTATDHGGHWGWVVAGHSRVDAPPRAL